MLVGFVGLFVIAWTGWNRRRLILQAIDRLEVQRAMGFGTQSDYEEQRRQLERRLDRAD